MKRWLTILTVLALVLGPVLGALAEEPAFGPESVESAGEIMEEAPENPPVSDAQPKSDEAPSGDDDDDDDEPAGDDDDEPTGDDDDDEPIGDDDDEPAGDDDDEPVGDDDDGEPVGDDDDDEPVEPKEGDDDLTVGEEEGPDADQISDIQKWLIALKYLEEGHITGEYDDDTAGAVAAFQQDHELEVTGICDETTYSLLKQLGKAALEEEDDGGDTLDVIQVQAWLRVLGYLSDSQLTGEMDEATVNALASFQQDNSLAPTGIGDAETLVLLKTLAEAASAAETGLTTEQIKQIQAWLVALKYLAKENQTGIYDDATIIAVKAFQLENNLPVTGEMDDATYKLLKQKGEAAASGNGNGSASFNRSGSGSGAAAGAGAAAQDARLNGVTPGTAMTSTHASGSKDTTPYGAIERNGGFKHLGISLRVGDSVDDLLRISYNAAVRDGTLALQGIQDGAVQRWTFDGLALRTLAHSGIDHMRFSGLALDTEVHFSGPLYDALRAMGCTENTFQYTVTVTEDGTEVTVDVQGRSYPVTLDEDGTMTLGEEAQ